jgi:hypothetical protein
VLSGVTDPNHGRLDPAPDTEAVDLAALVTDELSAATPGGGQQFPAMGGE